MVSLNQSLAEEEVLLITLKNFKTKRTYHLRFSSLYSPKRDDVEYVLCSRMSIELLDATLFAWWEDVQPEVVTGWNVDLFDTTYLCNQNSKESCGEN